MRAIPQVGFDDDGWRAARRWIATITALFADVRPAASDWTFRQIAERAAMTLAAGLPGAAVPFDPSATLVERAKARAVQQEAAPEDDASDELTEDLFDQRLHDDEGGAE